PIVRLSETYDGWKTNIIGNITMFIPVGLVWPLCFKQLNSVIKTTLAGALFSLVIELTQIMSYERCSDIDDIILNTTGVFIGSIIFFAIKKITGKKL
nr:VanZ family protein [Treponema sp.]